MTKSGLIDHTISLLNNFSRSENIFLAYSGGMDSHALLHLLASHRNNIRRNLAAIHVDHGLCSESTAWTVHCQAVCKDLDIDLIRIRLNATAPRGKSQEAWSRKLRYDAMKKYLKSGDLLLTAHHRDDQAETLLLQLFRGAGPAGLSAIPESIRLGEGWHVRPFLEFPGDQIEDYANSNDLQWIDDVSNFNERFDRNYLRHSVMPVIRQRWPGIMKTLSRSARIQSEVNNLLDELAATDLTQCLNSDNNTLKLGLMKSLPDSRAINLIRYWLRQQGHRSPGSTVLNQILIDIVNSGSESSPCIGWDDVEIRKYRDMIFITAKLPNRPVPDRVIPWDIAEECTVEFGRLMAANQVGTGIAIRKVQGKNFSVRFRHGNEEIKQGGHHHTLKNVFQEKGVPPCFRDLIPLIYLDGSLVEVTGLCIDEDFAADPEEESIRILWNKADEIYALNCIS